MLPPPVSCQAATAVAWLQRPMCTPSRPPAVCSPTAPSSWASAARRSGSTTSCGGAEALRHGCAECVRASVPRPLWEASEHHLPPPSMPCCPACREGDETINSFRLQVRAAFGRERHARAACVAVRAANPRALTRPALARLPSPLSLLTCSPSTEAPARPAAAPPSSSATSALRAGDATLPRHTHLSAPPPALLLLPSE